MRARANLVPICVALTGLASFSVMDGVMKAASIAVGAYAALFWRNLFGAILMTPVWVTVQRRNGGRWLPPLRVLRLHLARSALAGVMAVLFFWGTIYTPLAEAMALSFIAPLIALFLAAVFLGEQVKPRAFGGSVLALVGVAVIAAGKFGVHHSPMALLGVAALLTSAVLYAGNLVIQRHQAQLAGPDEIAFFQNVFITVLFAPGAWWLASLPTGHQIVLVGCGAVLAVTSLMLLGWAYARAEAQVLVPLEYTAFLWAALVGWLMFAEPVTARTMAGVVLIVTGCLIAISTRTVPGDNCQPNPA
ncbi:DMT family transporter [Novosphingobium sp.]|uniref:DMT family transporter n=1 Tax=Novosphingobium sp. TaxID=1874826 RepID=UPI00334208B3